MKLLLKAILKPFRRLAQRTSPVLAVFAGFFLIALVLAGVMLVLSFYALYYASMPRRLSGSGTPPGTSSSRTF